MAAMKVEVILPAQEVSGQVVDGGQRERAWCSSCPTAAIAALVRIPCPPTSHGGENSHSSGPPARLLISSNALGWVRSASSQRPARGRRAKPACPSPHAPPRELDSMGAAPGSSGTAPAGQGPAPAGRHVPGCRGCTTGARATLYGLVRPLGQARRRPPCHCRRPSAAQPGNGPLASGGALPPLINRLGRWRWHRRSLHRAS